MAGITSTGFDIKTLGDLVTEGQENILSVISPYMNLLPNTVIAQINEIHAEGLSQVWELAEDVFNATSLTGSGVSLDLNAAIMGKKREEATAGYIIDYEVTTAGATTIPATSFQVSNEEGTQTFSTREEFAISAAGAHEIKVYSDDTGSISVNSDTINEIVGTPPANVTAVNNPSTSLFVNGADQETDEELRARLQSNRFITAKGTVQGIKNAVFSANDDLTETGNSLILGCFAIENANDHTDAEGRRPHSVEVVVYYPQVAGSYDDETDLAVLTKIAGSVADGTETVSTTTDSFSDDIQIDNNTERETTCSRADEVDIYVDIDTLPNLSTDVKTQLASWVSDWISEYNLGEDIIVYGRDSLSDRLNSFQGAVLTDYTIKIARTASPTTDDNVSIDYFEAAIGDTANISIGDL